MLRSSARRLIYYIVAVIAMAIRPLLLIRFAPLRSGTLGFLASEPTFYLLEQRSTGSTTSHRLKNTPRTLDCLIPATQVANRYLLSMWRRLISVGPAAPGFIEFLRQHPSFRPHLAPWRDEQFYDQSGLLNDSPPLLGFTEDERKMGQKALQAMGVPDGAPFVCFSIRGNLVDQTTGTAARVEEERYRECSLESYHKAIGALQARGIYVLRMGSAVTTPLPFTEPLVIDYAMKFRSEFLDLFLCAHCYFFLGDSGGLVNVARIFKRPIALTNWIPMGVVNTAPRDTLIVHKRLLDLKTKTALSLKAQLQSSANLFTATSQYSNAALGWIDNTSDEIGELVEEMCLRQEGNYRSTPDAQRRQEQYWSLFPAGQLREPLRAQIGEEFLRRHL